LYTENKNSSFGLVDICCAARMFSFGLSVNGFLIISQLTMSLRTQIRNKKI